MNDYLNLAAKHLGVEVDDIIASKVYDDHIAVVVDKGIAGCPKYLIPLSDLESADASDLGIYELTYRELQALAKELGINARQSREDLIAALWPEGDEEE